MSPEQIAFAYFVATAVVVGLGMGGGTDKPVAGCAVLLGLIYVAGLAAHMIAPVPWGFAAYPVMDTIGALTATALWRRGAPAWVWWLALLFWLQIGFAAAFWVAEWRLWVQGAAREQYDAALTAYKWVNNSIYVLELCLVGWVGGFHVFNRFRPLAHRFFRHGAVHFRGAGHSSPPEGA